MNVAPQMPPHKRKQRRTARDTAIEALTTLGTTYLRERVHAVFDQFVTALLDAALGVRHVYVKDPTTQIWARVADPDTITALLNRPAVSTADPVWIIHTQDPDARLLDGISGVPTRRAIRSRLPSRICSGPWCRMK